MKVEVGSIWECIDEDSEHFGRLCVIKQHSDAPSFNGTGDIELLYANGARHFGKSHRFLPGNTHKLRRPAKSQRNSWMSDIRVTVYRDRKKVAERDVRSKTTGMAIVNVLTNHYKGEVDWVEAEYLWKGTWSEST